MIVVGDITTGIRCQRENLNIVLSLHGIRVDGTVTIVGPSALRGLVASRLGVEVALLWGALLSGPGPLAVLVIIAILLLVVLLIAVSEASLGAVVPSATGKVVAGSVGVEELALGSALAGVVQPDASVVGGA